MAGLSYGSSYQLLSALRVRKEGVVFMPNIGKYLVRIKTKRNTIKTVCAYKSKAWADKKYIELTT